MKNMLFKVLAVSLVIGLISLTGCATMKGKEAAKEEAMQADNGALGPVAFVATPNVAMDKKAKMVIMGTGFKPGQELVLLFTDANGVLTDIGYALKPAPKADATGTWGTTWSCGRFISKKLIKKGAYTITVADSDYNTLAVAPVNFYAKEKKDKKKK